MVEVEPGVWLRASQASTGRGQRRLAEAPNKNQVLRVFQLLHIQPIDHRGDFTKGKNAEQGFLDLDQMDSFDRFFVDDFFFSQRLSNIFLTEPLFSARIHYNIYD